MKYFLLFFFSFIFLSAFGQQEMLLNRPFVQTSSGGGDITAGLVGGWKMDEGTGSTVADFSGNGNPATLTGSGCTWGTSPYGNCITTDGSGCGLSIGTGSALQISGSQVTVCGWVKLTTTSGDQAVFNTGYNGVSCQTFQISINGATCDSGNANVLAWGDKTTSANIPVSLPTTSTGVWLFLAGVDDGVNVIFYVNGSPIASLPHFGTIPADLKYISIGADLSVGPRWQCQASYKDWRVYNRGLTPTEVATLNTNLPR